MPLDAIGMTGCSLLVSPEHGEALPSGGGMYEQGVFLPNVASALGADLFVQGFTFDAGANPAGVTASNGLALRLGGL